MLSNGTPSHSVTSCAKLVSCPCPEDIVPIISSTRPSGSIVISLRSRGAFQTGWCWRSLRPSSACGRLCQWLVVRSAETATQPPRRSLCLVNNDGARGRSWFLASARLFRPERTLAGDFLRQRGAHLETSSELSDWNSNLQATIAQPPREPGGSGPRPRRGGLRSTLERKSRATND